MPVTPAARARARDAARAAVAEQKRTYAERLRRILAAATPALGNAELSLGLELDEREVGRFLSDSPRLAGARPDAELRALVDTILAGHLAVAVRLPAPGARREVLVLEPHEARRLDRAWDILPLGADVGLRDVDLEDDALWSFGFSTSRPAPAAPMRRRALAGREVFPVVLGTLQLGTAGRPDPAGFEAVLRAAVEAGVEVFDTADSYALDDAELGEVERRLAPWAPGRMVVTKAGLRRPAGRWVPDGRPEHLQARAEASLRNLGVEALDLLLLHVVDPKVPLAESVGALARLLEAGKARAIGVCNVDAAQLEAACAVAPLAAVQVELSRFRPDALSLAERCEAGGIALMAHRPLGGHARKGAAVDAGVQATAARLGTSAARVQLAWLLAAAPGLVPVVGATRPESIRDSAAAATLALDVDAFAALDRGLPPRRGGDEVVIVCGPPGAGKTSRVQPFLDRGYSRLNRDELGGTYDKLNRMLAEGLAAGRRRWVLDNTYAGRASRQPVIAAARAAGVPTRCVHVDTPRAEAQYNACRRMLQRYGRLLGPDEYGKLEENDIPPAAIHHYFQGFEVPTVAEGFATVERVPFARGRTGSRPAVLLDIDGTLRRTRSGAPYPRDIGDIEVLPGRREKLAALQAEGWLLLGVSNQSGIARGDTDVATVEACFAATAAALGVPLPVRYCPHASGAIQCWCRKPMPGLGVQWIEAEDLDRDACVMVGDLPSDEEFAHGLGVRFEWAEAFFAPS